MIQIAKIVATIANAKMTEEACMPDFYLSSMEAIDSSAEASKSVMNTQIAIKMKHVIYPMKFIQALTRAGCNGKVSSAP